MGWTVHNGSEVILAKTVLVPKLLNFGVTLARLMLRASQGKNVFLKLKGKPTPPPTPFGGRVAVSYHLLFLPNLLQERKATGGAIPNTWVPHTI